jgi:glycosyltransferase involved in cell wall biosynthesis
MDMLVHASLIPEPFGQVVLEGMAARVPVVAAAGGGPAEIVQHDVNGVLCPMGDMAGLAHAMCELARQPERRKRLVDGGMATVAAYHPDMVGARLQRLYREVIVRAAAVRR